jgi:hypothetical protein
MHSVYAFHHCIVENEVETLFDFIIYSNYADVWRRLDVYRATLAVQSFGVEQND